MSDTYKDLDALVPTDRTVKLGGVVYTVPGDLPLEIYIRVNKASELEGVDEQAALDQMVGAMVDLFAWLYSDKPEESRIREDVGKVLKSRGVRFNTTLLQHVYRDDLEDESASDEDESGPTNPATRN
jgi:hypothetical protein